MSELMKWELADGRAVFVEIEKAPTGAEKVSRETGILKATESLKRALEPIRSTAITALDTFKEAGPDKVEIEIGVKLTAQAAAVIAKAGAEAHLTVRMTWESDASRRSDRKSTVE